MTWYPSILRPLLSIRKHIRWKINCNWWHIQACRVCVCVCVCVYVCVCVCVRASQGQCDDFLCVLTFPRSSPPLCLQVQQDAGRTACAWSAAPAGPPSASECGLWWVLVKLHASSDLQCVQCITRDNHVEPRKPQTSLHHFFPVTILVRFDLRAVTSDISDRTVCSQSATLFIIDANESEINV